MATPGIATPCNRICVLDQRTRLCIGCGRSLDEIAGWSSLSDAERATIMAQLPARLAELRNSAAARAEKWG